MYRLRGNNNCPKKAPFKKQCVHSRKTNTLIWQLNNRTNTRGLKQRQHDFERNVGPGTHDRIQRYVLVTQHSFKECKTVHITTHTRTCIHILMRVRMYLVMMSLQEPCHPLALSAVRHSTRPVHESLRTEFDSVTYSNSNLCVCASKITTIICSIYLFVTHK